MKTKIIDGVKHYLITDENILNILRELEKEGEVTSAIDPKTGQRKWSKPHTN